MYMYVDTWQQLCNEVGLDLEVHVHTCTYTYSVQRAIGTMNYISPNALLCCHIADRRDDDSLACKLAAIHVS